MVGRERELRAIEDRLRGLREGVGGVVTVVAENGMGKSRLLAEVCRLDVLEGVTLREGRALSLGRNLSFHPFVDLLRQWAHVDAGTSETDAVRALGSLVAQACGEEAAEVLPFLKTLMGWSLEPAERERIEGVGGEALEKLVRKNVRRLFERLSAAGPVVLVFEDLHWADESSLALLEALVPVVETNQILVIAAFRPGYEATGERFAAFVDQALPARHMRLELQPLASRECEVLIENLLGAVDLPHSIVSLIKERTEGNPFYIEEVLRSLVDVGALVREKDRLVATGKLHQVEIPGSIEELVMTRVERLDASAREVLQVASVIGRRFYRRILDSVAPAGADLDAAIRELVAKEFILEQASRRTATPRRVMLQAEQEYVFKHALTQEAVYGSLLKKSRRVLHLRCAEAFEQVFAGRLQDAYGMLAYHWTHAEQLDKAEEYLFKAGEQAARTAASAEALHFFREAYRMYLLAHGDKADPAKKALLEKNIGFALFNTGQLVESVEHMNSALRLYGQWVPTGPVALRCKLAMDLPVVLFRLYWPGGARTRRERPHDLDIYQTMYNRCRAQNPTDPTRNFFDNISSMRLLHHVDPARIEHGVGMYAANGAFFAFAGLSFPIARRFIAVAEKLVRPEKVNDRVEFLAMASVVDFHAGDWSSTHDIDEDLLENGLRSGLLWDTDIYLGFACERDLRQGKFDSARAYLDKLDYVIRSYGYDFSRSTFSAMTAYLLLEQRKLAEAREAMQAYHDSRDEEPLRVFALSGLARIDVLDGKLDAAARSLAQARQIISRAQRLSAFYCGAYWNSRLHFDLAMLEAGDGAGKHVERTAKRAAAVARNIARDRTECCRLTARAYWQLGKPAKAQAWWDKAIAQGELLEVRPELARVYADIGSMLRGADGKVQRFRDRDASQWLEAALAQFQALGLGWEIARLGAGGTPSPAAGADTRAVTA
jgi:tetratricopeptide (TPR) repeat protein